MRRLLGSILRELQERRRLWGDYRIWPIVVEGERAGKSIAGVEKPQGEKRQEKM